MKRKKWQKKKQLDLKNLITIRVNLKQHLYNTLAWILCILSLGIVIVHLESYLRENARYAIIKMSDNEGGDFRKQELSSDNFQHLFTFVEENSYSISNVLTVLMADHEFNLNRWNPLAYTIDEFQESMTKKETYCKSAYENLVKSYEQIWKDVKYFPVPDSSDPTREPVSYEDSWLFERNYGGKRAHEGTDIMAGDNLRNIYPIISMTDGIVENIGWLEMGGYRIGIRSPSGGYFYYAHLAGYDKEFALGEEIRAGQLLGYMGDTGYGTVEGTTGKFDVHLHLGIYIQTDNYEELSVNPYWVLRYLDNSKLQYDY